MDQHQRVALDDLVQEFADIFSTSKYDLGRTNTPYHNINTGDESPIKQPPCHIPIHYQKEVYYLFDKMKQQGVSEPRTHPSHHQWCWFVSEMGVYTSTWITGDLIPSDVQ